MRSSSRSPYGIGLRWFVRLFTYASSAQSSSARAIEEARLDGRCRCWATTARAFTTFVPQDRELDCSPRCTGLGRCRHCDDPPEVQEVAGYGHSHLDRDRLRRRIRRPVLAERPQGLSGARIREGSGCMSSPTRTHWWVWVDPLRYLTEASALVWRENVDGTPREEDVSFVSAGISRMPNWAALPHVDNKPPRHPRS